MRTGNSGYCWFCTECSHGPQTTTLNKNCSNCGQAMDERQTVVRAPEVFLQANMEVQITEEGIFEMPKFTQSSGDQHFSQAKDSDEDYDSDSDSSEDEDEDISFQEATGLQITYMVLNKEIEQQVKEGSASKSSTEGIGQRKQKVDERSAEENEKGRLSQLLGKHPTHDSASNLNSSIPMDTLPSTQSHALFRPLPGISPVRNSDSGDPSSDDSSDDDSSDSGHSEKSNDTDASSTTDMDASSRAHFLAWTMVNRLAGTFDWRTPYIEHPTNSNGGTSSKRGNSAMANTSSGQTSQSNKRRRTTQRNQASQPPDGGDDEDGDEGGNEHENKEESDSPGFACPFFVHEPRRLELRPSCRNNSWKTVHRVKEHIYRVHVVHQCLRCGDRFDSEELLLEHTISEEGCLAWVPLPMLGANQSKIAALKSKKAIRGRTHEENWKNVYCILFPNEPRIPSPYYSDIQQSVLQEENSINAPLREHRFWNHLYETLFTDLKTTFDQYLESKELISIDDELKGVLSKAINHARSELSFSGSSEVSPDGDLASPLGRLDVTEDVKASGEHLSINLEDNGEIDFMEFSNTFPHIPFEDTDYNSQSMMRIMFPDIALPGESNDTSIPPRQILDIPSNIHMNFIDDPRVPMNGTTEQPLSMIVDAMYEEERVPQPTDSNFILPMGEVPLGTSHPHDEM